MRKIKTFEAELSASNDLTLIQRIPSDQLHVMEQIYATMLQAIREALTQREKAIEESEQCRISLGRSPELTHFCS